MASRYHLPPNSSVRIFANPTFFHLAASPPHPSTNATPALHSLTPMIAIAHPVILLPDARDTPTTLAATVMAILEAAVMGDWMQMGIPQEAEAVGLGLRRRIVGKCLLSVREEGQEIYFLENTPGEDGRGTRILLQWNPDQMRPREINRRGSYMAPVLEQMHGQMRAPNPSTRSPTGCKKL